MVMGEKKEKAGLSLNGDQRLTLLFWCAVCPYLSFAMKEQIGLKGGFLQISFVLQEVKVLSPQAQNYLNHCAAWHVLFTRAVVQLLVHDGFP